MNYITNNKGGRKLTYEGYMYTMKAVTSTSTRWECSQRNSTRCKGLLRTDIINPQTILSQTPYYHLGSDIEVKVAEVKQKIKVDLIETASNGGSTHQTLCANLAQLSREERAEFGNHLSVKRNFNRYIAQGRPDNPETLEDLVIGGTWADDVDGNIFLIHDNNDNTNRIIVFGNENCIQHLANISSWFMYSTFKVVPAIFNQLYVIHAPLDDSTISLVYVFMSSKSEASYIELFQIISDKCAAMGLQLDPLWVMVDFEKAMMNAIKKMFWSACKCEREFLSSLSEHMETYSAARVSSAVY